MTWNSANLSERERRELLEKFIQNNQRSSNLGFPFDQLERTVKWGFSFVIERPVTRMVDIFLNWLRKKR